MNDTTPYRYAGLPLTPSVAALLIQELFSGQTVERKQIINDVLSTHIERGGRTGAELIPTIKKALSNLAADGLVSNPANGFWRVSGDTADDAAPAVAEPVEPATRAEVVSGEGEGSVYLYYYEAYRRLAEFEGASRFRCKIGRTVRDPAVRVGEQTGAPEKPTLSRHYKTRDGAALERAIHAILDLANRRCTDTPGKEWFATSPAEVDGIVRAIDAAAAAVRGQ